MIYHIPFYSHMKRQQLQRVLEYMCVALQIAPDTYTQEWIPRNRPIVLHDTLRIEAHPVIARRINKYIRKELCVYIIPWYELLCIDLYNGLFK